MNTLIKAKKILASKVQVTYPDGKNSHTITLSDVIDRFKNEDENWLDVFINVLINTGENYTNMGAHYSVIPN